MIMRLVGIACVLLGAAVSAQRPNPYQQRKIEAPLPAATEMTCQGGRYAANGKLIPAENANGQRQPGMTAKAIAIDVQASTYAYTDSPLCPGGSTDAVTEALAKTQLSTSTTKRPTDILSELQQRANLLGRDALALVVGLAQERTSRCQVFVTRAPVRASAIRLVEFRAHQNQASDNRRCFEARMQRGRSGVALGPTQGGCAISWSGWQSAMVLDDPGGGAVVAAVFKNWSHDRMRTGQIWVWYEGPAAEKKRQAE